MQQLKFTNYVFQVVSVAIVNISDNKDFWKRRGTGWGEFSDEKGRTEPRDTE